MSGNKKIVLITSSIVIAIFVLLLILIIQFIKIGTLRKQESALLSSYNSLTQQIQDHENQLPYLEDRENFLTQYAHEHNWTKPDDQWYATK